MIRQMWVIFIMVANIFSANSQIIDDFSEVTGPFSNFWSGDTEKFIVNAAAELQLNDESSGAASLYQETAWVDEMSWEIFVKMDFSPSNSNRLELFLWSDSTAINKGNGYFLNIGENGSMDAIRLMKRSQGESIEIASGSLGLVAQSPIVLRIKAWVTGDDMFHLEVDDLGGVCFLPEIETQVDIPDSASNIYFGWRAMYTSTRADRFFFDDIYVGSLRIDQAPPQVLQVLPDEGIVEIAFSEPIDRSTLTSANFALTPIVDDLNITIQKQRVNLSSPTGFDNSISYVLQLSEVLDLSGNRLDTLLEFIVPRNATPQDLLINEILFNPSASGADYVEIYNNTTDLISLRNVLLSNSDNNDVTSLSSLGYLENGSYLVVTNDKRNIEETYPLHDASKIFEITIPRFNNDSGNVTLRRDDSIIDSFDYDEDFHQELIDDVDGISLERRSLNQLTNESTNWSSALSKSFYGTPGLKNSISGEVSSDGNIIEIEEKVFTPDGDGVKDQAIVNYQLDAVGYVGSFRIYNESGQLMKVLSQNEILASSGQIKWDGHDDAGTLSPIGLYIFHISLFSLDGNTIQKKIAVGLAKPFN